jgi:hypothetical protein
MDRISVVVRDDVRSSRMGAQVRRLDEFVLEEDEVRRFGTALT